MQEASVTKCMRTGVAARRRRSSALQQFCSSDRSASHTCPLSPRIASLLVQILSFVSGREARRLIRGTGNAEYAPETARPASSNLAVGSPIALQSRLTILIPSSVQSSFLARLRSCAALVEGLARQSCSKLCSALLPFPLQRHASAPPDAISPSGTPSTH